MNLITIKPWLAYSCLLFICISFFAPLSSLAQSQRLFKRPRRGKMDYLISPSIGVEYVYLNDRLLSYSTYSTVNLFYKLRTSLITRRYDISLDFRYASQSYSLHEGVDLQGVLEGDSYELSLSYQYYFPGSSYYIYLGGSVLGYFSVRETNIYDARLLLGEAFTSGLVSLGYVKKFSRLVFLLHIDLPMISYIFGTRYDITYPVYADEKLKASDAVPRNVLERENEFSYLLSSDGAWRLPYQLFYGVLRGSLVYPFHKRMRLGFNYELRYIRFENSMLFHSYNRFISLNFTYQIF